jgi:hypothetical protein
VDATGEHVNKDINAKIQQYHNSQTLTDEQKSECLAEMSQDIERVSCGEDNVNFLITHPLYVPPHSRQTKNGGTK